MDPSRPVMPRPAAAIVLLRTHEGGGIEVFMVRRHLRNEFAPDVFVFPGGTVKADDRQIELDPTLCAAMGPGATTLGSGFRAAALRECFEEAGVLLASVAGHPLVLGPGTAERFATYREELQAKARDLASVLRAEGLTLATDALVHWAHWITPEESPLRYDTHFFLASMPAGQEAAYDQVETTDGQWTAPEEALHAFDAGAFPLVFATAHQLRALTGMANVGATMEHFVATTPRTIAPRIVTREGARIMVLPDEADVGDEE